ncbi:MULTISPECIES: hypothetical protein [unclassified Streptomyces]|uniref:hypothetical protein n=1 Tax=unclassified Streptomyces TaxID=2593676 RepID=UPI000851B6A8|nr:MULTISPECIES: hypothetical protein [unclassified Streptomyces]
MSEQRLAETGELCTCGRPAIAVYSSTEFGDVGHCGVEGSAQYPVLPCPWCGSTVAHKTSWGDPDRCPHYRLRPPASP